jgi:hypothetical protein
MCGPTTLSPATNKDAASRIPEDETSTKKNCVEMNSCQEPKHRGFLYGTLSLALLVTAASVVMGFNQSKRDKLGCDVQCIGTMTSARSTLTLVGSTIIGKCSDSRALDRIGGARRAFLLIGVVASALDLLMSFQASSINALWISMIPSALFQQNFTVLKALFIEYHDESASAAERAGRVGKLGMAVGLAFMAGPLLGSVFFKDHRTAAIFAGACLLGAMFFIVLLPSPPRPTSMTKHGEDQLLEKNESSSSSLLGFRRFLPDLVPAARTPPAVFIMVSRIFMALSFHIFQTIWAVALRERFNFGPKDYGRYYSFIGFGFAISQGFLAKYLVRKIGESDRGRKQLLLMCAVALGGGRFIAYQTNRIKVVYLVFGLIVTALGVINTIFTADTSKIASPSELGGLFGVLGSMESLAGISGPILGGLLARYVHPIWGPLCAVLTLYGFVFLMIFFGYERIVCQGKNIEKRKKD